MGRKPNHFNISELGRYWGVVWGIARKRRDCVENKGRKFEQAGLAPIVQAEEGDGRVHILDFRENGGFIAGHVHPLKFRRVLYVKESFG